MGSLYVVVYLFVLGSTLGFVWWLAGVDSSELAVTDEEHITEAVSSADSSVVEEGDRVLDSQQDTVKPTEAVQTTPTEVTDTDTDVRTALTEVATITESDLRTVLAPPENGVYWGAFAGFGPYEETVNQSIIAEFTSLTESEIAWGYFSDNWFFGIDFPEREVAALVAEGITPYIRIMPRTDFRKRPGDTPYTLEAIAAGEFDAELTAWAEAARDTEVPLIVEFGTEVNGNWFPWNGSYHGAGETSFGDPALADGPERFILAYRHLIELFDAVEADNITWVYHANAVSAPDTDWNNVMAYYPGDTYIDWIGVSVYGAQSAEDPWVDFHTVYAPAYQTIVAATDKPIGIVEFGVAEGPEPESKAEWLTEAFGSIAGGQYPQTKALAYWHSQFMMDGVDHNLKLDSSSQSLETTQEQLRRPVFVTELEFAPEPSVR